MRLYLLRHGLTRYNEEKRYQGVGDTPLSPEGRARLCPAAWQPGRVYVSPLRRARETAGILFPHAVQTVVEDLREMDFGAFEGHTYGELSQNPDYLAWLDGNCLGPCPGGESKGAFCDRVCAAVEGILDAVQDEEDPLVIVAHGGTQMAVMERFVRPKRDYYAWSASCGGGFLLEWTVEEWRATGRLRLLEMVDLVRKEGESC